MLLGGEQLASLLKRNPLEEKDPLTITPTPDLDALAASGSASVDLRLGTWITTPRQTRVPFLKVDAGTTATEPELLRSHYVRFGEKFYLHPHNFVLAVTLEWLRLPACLGGYLVGRSSWGRRGLIIATAVGVHPGFAGCLTLELTNLGEIPIELLPGMTICQLFLHQAVAGGQVDRSSFVGFRRPTLGRVAPDHIATVLGNSHL
jgi:dCTP deaminase